MVTYLQEEESFSNSHKGAGPLIFLHCVPALLLIIAAPDPLLSYSAL